MIKNVENLNDTKEIKICAVKKSSKSVFILNCSRIFKLEKKQKPPGTNCHKLRLTALCFDVSTESSELV